MRQVECQRQLTLVGDCLVLAPSLVWKSFIAVVLFICSTSERSLTLRPFLRLRPAVWAAAAAAV